MINTSDILSALFPSSFSVLFKNMDYMNYLENKLSINDDIRFDIITQPLKFIYSDYREQQKEYFILHPLAVAYIYIFYIKQNFKMNNFFELNSIFSIEEYEKCDLSANELEEKISTLLDMKFVFPKSIIENKFISYSSLNVLSSIELNKLERKYTFYSNDYYDSYKEHIYTHSLDWAYLGNKDLAKKFLNYKSRFSSQLDTLMQKINYNETNGIINGSHFSSIIGEIILTRIDRLIYDYLKEKGFSFKNDYEIVRIGEQIHIFTNNYETITLIKDAYFKHSHYYKINLNISNPIKNKKPYISFCVWKHQINEMVKSNLCSFFSNIQKKRNASNTIFTNLFNHIKSLLLSNEYDYTIVSYSLYCILMQMLNSISISSKKLTENIIVEDNANVGIKVGDLISNIFDFYNFLFDITSLDLKERNINLLITTMEIMNKFILSEFSNDAILEHEINDLCFNIYSQIVKYNITNTTEIRTAILFASFCKKNLPQNLLTNFINNSNDDISYIIITQYIFQKRVHYKYHKLQKIINNFCIEKLNELDKYFNIDTTAPLQIKKTDDYKEVIGRMEYIILSSVSKTGLPDSTTSTRINQYITLVSSMNLGFKINKVFVEFSKQGTSWINWNISKNELLYQTLQDLTF